MGDLPRHVVMVVVDMAIEHRAIAVWHKYGNVLVAGRVHPSAACASCSSAIQVGRRRCARRANMLSTR